MTFLRLGIVLVLVIATTNSGVYGVQIELELLKGMLKNYDPFIRPSPADTNGTVVSTNMYVRSFDSFDHVKSEYSVQLTFRQQWMDSRLRFSQRDSSRPYLTLLDSSRIWVPDVFFTNEKIGHTHNLLRPNQYVRIFPDGSVLYSIRVSLTLSCPMALKNFPFDKQVCSLRLASYAYTTDDIIFKWKQGDPVQITQQLHCPDFELEKFTTHHCDSHTNTGVYSCLRVDFNLKRYVDYYLVQIYVPCTAMVIMAGLAFWLSKTEIIGRILVTIMAYLMTVVGIYYINISGPRVSYTKALDLWTGPCLTFIFFAMIESILVNFLSRREAKTAILDKPTFNLLEAFRESPLSGKIDMVSRILYPVAFVIFAGIYMAAYCSSSNED